MFLAPFVSGELGTSVLCHCLRMGGSGRFRRIDWMESWPIFWSWSLVCD